MPDAMQEQMTRTFVVVLSPICFGFVLWIVVRGYRWFRRKGY